MQMLLDMSWNDISSKVKKRRFNMCQIHVLLAALWEVICRKARESKVYLMTWRAISARPCVVEAAAARRAEVHALVLLAGGFQRNVNMFLWDLLVGVGLSMTKNGSV